MPSLKLYQRDGRSPLPKRESTSKVMSANKGKNTKPEVTLRKELWAAGLRGYRLHLKKIPGRPDIAFTVKGIAIFVNGCYWHRCPYCELPYPKTHTDFWVQKFDKNIERDKRKIKQLKAAKWKSIVIWECQIKKDLRSQVEKVIKAVNGSN